MMESKGVQDECTGETSVEALTLMTIQQLKHALYIETEAKAEAIQQVQALSHENNMLAAALNDAEAVMEHHSAALELEQTRLQLTLQSSSSHASEPGFVVRALQSLLPPPTDQQVTLTCCIRVGEGWCIVNGSSEQHRSIKSTALDEAARSVRPELPELLLSLVPIDTLCRIIDIDDVTSEGLGEATAAFESAYIISALARCLWLVTPIPAPAANLNANSSANANTNTCAQVAGFLTGGMLGLLETASQLAIAALVRQFEAQRALTVAAIGRVSVSVCNHLFASGAGGPDRTNSSSVDGGGSSSGSSGSSGSLSSTVLPNASTSYQVWSQLPSALSEAIASINTHTSIELFLVAPEDNNTNANASSVAEAPAMIALTSTANTVAVRTSPASSLLALACAADNVTASVNADASANTSSLHVSSSGIRYASGGAGLAGTDMALDCGGDSGFRIVLVVPMFSCAVNDPLLPGYRLLATVRTRTNNATHTNANANTTEIDTIVSIISATGGLIRTWLSLPGQLSYLFSPLTEPQASTITNNYSNSSASASASPGSSDVLSTVASSLQMLLAEEVGSHGGADASASASKRLPDPALPAHSLQALPLPALCSYLQLDWLATITATAGKSTSASVSKATTHLTLTTAAGSRPLSLSLDELTGPGEQLRALISFLLSPPVGAMTADSSQGLLCYKILPTTALAGVAALLGAGFVKDRLHAACINGQVPANMCATIGARLECRAVGLTPNTNTNPSASTSAFGPGTCLVLGGVAWRGVAGISAGIVVPKLRGLGQVLCTAAAARFNSLTIAPLRLQLVSQLREAAQLTALRQRLADSAVLTNANNNDFTGLVDVNSISNTHTNSNTKLRRGLVAALQAFVGSVYLPPDANTSNTASASVSGGISRRVVCQLAVSESVTEEGENRQWLLQPSGDWTPLNSGSSLAADTTNNTNSNGSSSEGGDGARYYSLAVAALADTQRDLAFTMQGPHRTLLVYSENCEESVASGSGGLSTTAHFNVNTNSSAGVSLRVFALLGWAVTDINTNLPVDSSVLAALGPPPSPLPATEAAFLSLASAFVSRHKSDILGGSITTSLYGINTNASSRNSGGGTGAAAAGGGEWEAGEGAVSAVRACALAGATRPLQTFLGHRTFLSGLHARAPGFALIPLRIGEGPGPSTGVWDITAPADDSPSASSNNAATASTRRVPARLAETILRASAGRLPINNSLPEAPTSQDVSVVAGGASNGSCLLALSGMGGCVLSHLAGSGAGLSLGLDKDEQLNAMRVLGITRRSLVMLYLAPPSAGFDDNDGDVHSSPLAVAGFLCVVRGHRLTPPSSLALLLSLLDSATLPLRLGRAIAPLFTGSDDGASMLIACNPCTNTNATANAAVNPNANTNFVTANGVSGVSGSISAHANNANSNSSSNNSANLHALSTGEEEWCSGLPLTLTKRWLDISRRDVLAGLPQRANCVRASAYTLSGLLPTPLSAPNAFANPKATATANANTNSILPEWRLVLAHAMTTDVGVSLSVSSSLVGSSISGGSTSGLGGLVDQELVLAACPAPVPGAGLQSGLGLGTGATTTVSDADIMELGSGMGTGLGVGLGAGEGLSIGWEDRALPPSALSGKRSFSGPCRLFRVFLTLPRGWLRGLPLATNSANTTAAGSNPNSGASVNPNARIVIASQLFWLEGVGAPLSLGVRVRLLKTALQAGSLFSSLLLDACRNVLTVAALGNRVVSLRSRLDGYASTTKMVRGVVKSGISVAKQCIVDGGDENVRQTLLPELTRLYAALEQSEAGLARGLANRARAVALQGQNDGLLLAPLSADAGTPVAINTTTADDEADGDNSSIPIATPSTILIGPAETGGQADSDFAAVSGILSGDSLVGGEDDWLRVCVESCGEALGIMATVTDQLMEEKRQNVDMRKALAASRLQLQSTATHMREFASEVANMLPASVALRALETRLQQEAHARQAAEKEREREAYMSCGVSTTSDAGDNEGTNTHANFGGRVEMNVSHRYIDAVCEVVALTTRALSDVLDLACRLGFREEASQVLAQAAAPVLHPSLLAGSRVNWDDKGVCVVWTDGQAPPTHCPAIAGNQSVLSWDLLKQAWRRGMRMTGSVGNFGPDVRELLNKDGGRWAIEYVPCPRAESDGLTIAAPGSPGREGREDEESVNDGYPRFIIQYLVSGATAGGDVLNTTTNTSTNVLSSPGGASWNDKFAVIRGWLEDMLWCTPAVRPGPGFTEEAHVDTPNTNTSSLGAGYLNTPRSSGGGYPSPVACPGESIDSAKGLVLLLQAARAPLDGSRSQWADFTVAASLALSAMLRADACLLLPDNTISTTSTNTNTNVSVDANGSSSEEAANAGGRQGLGTGHMWGTVCRHVAPNNSSAGGGSRPDDGPVVLTEGQAAALMSKTGTTARWLQMRGLSSTNTNTSVGASGNGGGFEWYGPGVLSEALFGAGGGAKCVIAVPLTSSPHPHSLNDGIEDPNVETNTITSIGAGTSTNGWPAMSDSPTWLAVLQAPRRLSQQEINLTHAFVALVASLASQRVGSSRQATRLARRTTQALQLQARLLRACWVRDAHAFRSLAAARIRRAYRSTDGISAESSTSNESAVVSAVEPSTSVDEEDVRLTAVVEALLGDANAVLPHLPLPVGAALSLVRVSSNDVWAATLFLRGGEAANADSNVVMPTAAARCAASGRPIYVGAGDGASDASECLFPVGQINSRPTGGQSHSSASLVLAVAGKGQGDAWVLRLSISSAITTSGIDAFGLVRTLSQVSVSTVTTTDFSLGVVAASQDVPYTLPRTLTPTLPDALDVDIDGASNVAIANTNTHAQAEERALQAALLHDTLISLAQDVKLALSQPLTHAALSNTNTSLNALHKLTLTLTRLTALVGSHLDLVSGLPALSAAVNFAAILTNQEPGQGTAAGNGLGLARLHYFDATVKDGASESDGGWRVADSLPDDEAWDGQGHKTVRVAMAGMGLGVPEPPLTPVAKMLKEGRWRVRESPVSAATLSRVSSSASPNTSSLSALGIAGLPGVHFSPDDVVPSAPANSGSGTSSTTTTTIYRVWVDASDSQGLAVLELHLGSLLLPTIPVAGSNTEDSGTVEENANPSGNTGAAPLLALGLAMRKALHAVNTRLRGAQATALAEKALGLSRRQQRVLATCLGELCTEGRLSEPAPASAHPTCPYIPVMLGRIQTELASLPSLVGTLIRVRDSVQAVDLCSNFVAAPGWGGFHPLLQSSNGADRAYLRPVTVTVGQSLPLASSPAAARLQAALGSSSDSNNNSSPGGSSENKGVPDFATFTATDPAGDPSVLEFAFTCGEIAGSLIVYTNTNATTSAHANVNAGTADTSVGGNVESKVAITADIDAHGTNLDANADSSPDLLGLGAHAAAHEAASSHLYVSLSRAIARRVFELHRGYRNQQIMIKTQQSSLGLKAELAARHQMALEMESAKSVAVTQLQQTQEDLDTLRVQLRQEKAVAQEAIERHKALAKQLSRVQADTRNESDKELAELKAESNRREAIANAELARREAVIGVLREDKRSSEKIRKELAVALEREKALESGRYELALSNSELQSVTQHQRTELKELQSALADSRKAVAALEQDKTSQHEAVHLYEQEKARADRLQQFVDLLKR